MSSVKSLSSFGTKTLLSVDEAAILLGITRSTAYRAIRTGTFPVPIIKLGGRFRVPRTALMRLIENGELKQAMTVSTDNYDSATCPTCGSAATLSTTSVRRPRRSPICSAARRSSSGTGSV